mmetsp:Transcript_20504/g.58572  ORF Transcript_20504/g.58572 Transcript_20504/m.58572 type:complete len:243 (-) Transcript_20504:623-1351(-)
MPPWPGAYLLTEAIFAHRRRLCGRVVVELGAGAALPGLLAANFASHTILTDCDPAVLSRWQRQKREGLSVPMADEVASARSLSSENVSFTRLEWGDRGDEQGLVRLLGENGQDQERMLIIGADLVYPATSRETLGDLFGTVGRLLQPNRRSVGSDANGDPAACLDRPCFMLSFIPRGNDPQGLLANAIDAAHQEGLVHEEVPVESPSDPAARFGPSWPHESTASWGGMVLVFYHGWLMLVDR